mmetsp:Transcript_64076/g.75859  ORF Transcript_64076/g.75859 Transcript_64076/m.75859 type:complete len:305 (+) Transcript_64076:743-1657(+)
MSPRHAPALSTGVHGEAGVARMERDVRDRNGAGVEVGVGDGEGDQCGARGGTAGADFSHGESECFHEEEVDRHRARSEVLRVVAFVGRGGGCGGREGKYAATLVKGQEAQCVKRRGEGVVHDDGRGYRFFQFEHGANVDFRRQHLAGVGGRRGSAVAPPGRIIVLAIVRFGRDDTALLRHHGTFVRHGRRHIVIVRPVVIAVGGGVSPPVEIRCANYRFHVEQQGVLGFENAGRDYRDTFHGYFVQVKVIVPETAQTFEYEGRFRVVISVVRIFFLVSRRFVTVALAVFIRWYVDDSRAENGIP